MTHPEPLPAERPRGAMAQTACFSVHGIADPGLLPRVVELWAKRGLTPARSQKGIPIAVHDSLVSQQISSPSAGIACAMHSAL